MDNHAGTNIHNYNIYEKKLISNIDRRSYISSHPKLFTVNHTPNHTPRELSTFEVRRNYRRKVRSRLIKLGLSDDEITAMFIDRGLMY